MYSHMFAVSGTKPMMEMNGIREFDIFVTRHQNQLESSGVPKFFWESLYTKLHAGVSQSFRFSI